ncbi:hypothetical protein M1D89_09820 [Arthrobacter sp. D3-18]
MKRVTNKLSAVFLPLLRSSRMFVVIALRAMPYREDRERGDVPGWVMITFLTVV